MLRGGRFLKLYVEEVSLPSWFQTGAQEMAIVNKNNPRRTLAGRQGLCRRTETTTAANRSHDILNDIKATSFRYPPRCHRLKCHMYCHQKIEVDSLAYASLAKSDDMTPVM